MQVLVTGANGWVGSAVVAELIAHGYDVTGLVRSEAGAEIVRGLGARAVLGNLDQPESLASAAKAADAVIHTAFNHDFSRFVENGAAERAAIEAMGEALAETGKTLIVTSGVGLVDTVGLVTEADRAGSRSPLPRAPEAAIDSFVQRGVRMMAVRLAPSVHGPGDKGFIPMIIGLARAHGHAAYIGEGDNRWSGVHRLDAAALYRLVLENGAAGERYHGVADEGVAMREIATVISKQLEMPVLSKSPEQAAEYYTWMAMFAARNMAASSFWTRKQLGWEPVQPGLLAELDSEAYFPAR